MTVRTTNERYVYSVSSETNPNLPPYRVDLLANNGAGACSCIDHATRRQPNIDAGADPFSRECACKHVRAVQWYFLSTLLRALANREKVPNGR